MIDNTTVYTPGALAQHVLSIDDRYAILQPELAASIVDDIASYLRSPHMYLSFDVFDTLLLRNHQSELRRFFEVSALVSAHINQRVHSSITPHDALIARLTANRLSYRLSPMVDGCREGNINEIYRLLLTQCQIPAHAELIAECVDIELAYEITQLTVNQPLFDLMHRHRAQGGHAIYVSDMYLSKAHIDRLFVGLGVDVRVFTHGYSSADTILSKRSGKIWSWLCAQLGAQMSDFVHVGDSLVSDYQSPRAHGISAVHIPIPLQMRRDIMADHGALVQELESVNIPVQSWMSTPDW